jgi:hypothetical protein
LPPPASNISVLKTFLYYTFHPKRYYLALPFIFSESGFIRKIFIYYAFGKRRRREKMELKLSGHELELTGKGVS